MKMKRRKMKTGWTMAALTALLLSFACAGPAFADTLGNTLARELCGSSETTYRLTSSQVAQWIGLAVNGAYSKMIGRTISSYYFAKSVANDDEATCQKVFKTPSSTDCQQWKVTRSGNVLTGSTSASRCD